MAYQVQLDTYHGPLDLLLYLVKKEEVDILTVSITQLADQFLEYLDALQHLDVELAGEFLVLAATLMEIKVRSLIPVEESQPEAESAEDPRRELVKQLLEYRKFKDAAAALEAEAEKSRSYYVRIPDAERSSPGQPVVKSVELWDLVSAFARIMRETQATQPQILIVDDTPQHVYEAWVLEQVRLHGRLAFRELFTPPYHRTRLVGLFLATLELIKTRSILLEQPELFSDNLAQRPS